MDYCVQLGFDNINAPRARRATASTTSRSPRAWAARRSACTSRRRSSPAIEQAERWMAEFQVPVVIEIMLERVTNISMGTEIDTVDRVRGAGAVDRGRADRHRPAGLDQRRITHAQVRRQPVDALQRSAVSRSLRRAPPRPASRPSSSCFPTPIRPPRSRRASTQHGLQLVLHNLPAGDWDAGERGIACHARPRRANSATAWAKAIEYATALGVPQLNCLAGIAPAGCRRRDAAHRPSSPT